MANIINLWQSKIYDTFIVHAKDKFMDDIIKINKVDIR